MPKKIGDIEAARFRKRVRGKKIVLASQAEIDKFTPEFIDDFLDRIFQLGASLVTHETRLPDFVSFGNDPNESGQTVAKVRAEYGITVDIHDRLCELLHRIV